MLVTIHLKWKSKGSVATNKTKRWSKSFLKIVRKDHWKLLKKEKKKEEMAKEGNSWA